MVSYGKSVLLFVLITIISISFVSAESKNTMLDDIGLSTGILKNEFTYSDNHYKDLNSDLYIQGKYDIVDLKWYHNGELVKSVSKTRDYNYNPSSLVKAKTDKVKVVYKAGRDKTTKRNIHKVTAKFEGGEHSWFLLE